VVYCAAQGTEGNVHWFASPAQRSRMQAHYLVSTLRVRHGLLGYLV
jgi:hypothetical protein